MNRHEEPLAKILMGTLRINVAPNSQGGSSVSKKAQTSEHFLSKTVVSYRVSFRAKTTERSSTVTGSNFFFRHPSMPQVSGFKDITTAIAVKRR